MDGMFALVIYDKKNNTIFLARDRAGKKTIVLLSFKWEIYF
jgi:asparagine synthetase B (glutamine-hydrolysing)